MDNWQSTIRFSYNWQLAIVHCQLVKLVFYNICHHIFHLQTGSPYLLWDKTGCRHARSRIDFEQFWFTVRRNDIIHTDQTFRPQYVVILDVSRCTFSVSSAETRAGVISCTCPLYLASKSKNSLSVTTSVSGNTTSLSAVL